MTLRAIRISVRTRPKHAVCTSWSAKLPSPTNVAGLATTSFAFRKPDESDEEADAGRGRMLQAIRHAVDDLFADARNSEHEENNAGKENYAQRSAPGNVHAQANGIGKVGVERHSRRERNGIVGVKAHHQRADRGGKASGENHALDRHPRLGQDLRIDDDDVSHRQESGEAAEKFLLHGGLIFGELEIAIEQSSYPSIEKSWRHQLRRDRGVFNTRILSGFSCQARNAASASSRII